MNALPLSLRRLEAADAAPAAHREWQSLAAAMATTALGLGLGLAGGVVLVVPLALPVVVGVVLRPSFGAYLFLFANPLIVGIARGDVVPLLRPNELLLGLLLLALALRLALRVMAGQPLRAGFNAVDGALLGLAVAGSLLPLGWRLVRSLPVTLDDVLYAIVLWKYLALYGFFRQIVETRRQVLLCLLASMASGVIVAVVAMLQVSNLFGVPELLQQHYDDPFTGGDGPVTSRGTSTIASSFGTADVMIMNLLIALALLRWLRWRSWLLAGGAALFLSGAVAAGAFSGFIGLGFALFVFAVATREIARLAMAALPMALLGGIAFWPVIAGRLEGFTRPSGLPQSWEGRWENLRDFFLPEIVRGVNWLTGVRPAARVPGPESWREWVYIESGYVWLLWIGGVPFLFAFIAFVVFAGWYLWHIARRHEDMPAVVATVAISYLGVIVLLMLLDPHLTVRGSADLFFPLLALALFRPPARPPVPAAAMISPPPFVASARLSGLPLAMRGGTP